MLVPCLPLSESEHDPDVVVLVLQNDEELPGQRGQSQVDEANGKRMVARQELLASDRHRARVTVQVQVEDVQRPRRQPVRRPTDLLAVHHQTRVVHAERVLHRQVVLARPDLQRSVDWPNADEAELTARDERHQLDRMFAVEVVHMTRDEGTLLLVARLDRQTTLVDDSNVRLIRLGERLRQMSLFEAQRTNQSDELVRTAQRGGKDTRRQRTRPPRTQLLEQLAEQLQQNNRSRLDSETTTNPPAGRSRGNALRRHPPSRVDRRRSGRERFPPPASRSSSTCSSACHPHSVERSRSASISSSSTNQLERRQSPRRTDASSHSPLPFSVSVSVAMGDDITLSSSSSMKMRGEQVRN